MKNLKIKMVFILSLILIAFQLVGCGNENPQSETARVEEDVNETYEDLKDYYEEIEMKDIEKSKIDEKPIVLQSYRLEVLRNYIWNERIPTIVILFVIVNLFQGITSKDRGKENYLGCKSFKEFLIRFNKRENTMRSALLVSSTLVLAYQIYKQIRYNYGFPFIYGPLFIVLPLIYILFDFTQSLFLWRKSNKVFK